MGGMYEARCPCGYTSGTLLEGRGMSGPDSARVLARCRGCREILSMRASKSTGRCPRCRGDLDPVAVPYGSLLDPEPPDDPPRSECPRCREVRLELIPVGDWD